MHCKTLFFCVNPTRSGAYRQLPGDHVGTPFCPPRCIHGSGICLRFSKIFPKPSASCIRSTLTRRAPGFLSTGTPAPSKQLMALVPRTFPLADSSRSFSFDFDENTQMLPLPCMHRNGQACKLRLPPMAHALFPFQRRKTQR